MLLIVGDPHGNLACVLDACREHHPSAVVLLGDQELQAPLAEVLAPIYAAGVPVYWLIGNHDTDSATYYDHLVSSLSVQPDGHLGGRMVTVGDWRIGGISGVYASRVWYPVEGDEPPRYRTRAEYLRGVLRFDRWRAEWSGPEIPEHRGLPRSMRGVIYPEDVECMAGHRLDIVVSHEAPRPPNRHGFGALHRLADMTGARLWIHGHHHRPSDEMVPLPSGRLLRVVGLGVRQCLWLPDLR